MEWKDGSTSWLSLKQLKETNPVKVAQYAVNNCIDAEPAFDWWVRELLKRQKRLIKAGVSRHRRAGYKFGIRLPESTQEALRYATDDGTMLWRDAIEKAMENVKVAFHVLE
ncbi:MAG: hypothetical protein ACRDL7_08110, partial [Gaiellaceae bacterium]